MQQATQVYDEAIEGKVIGILKNMTSDWDTGFSGEIHADTHLVADLCCESIDMVQFVVALEETFKRRDLPIEHLLMVDGRYVDDLTVRQVVKFLSTYIH